MDTKNKIITVVGAVALIASAGIGGYTLFATPDDNLSVSTTTNTSARTPTVSTVPSATSASQVGSSVSTTGTIADGTYTAISSYSVPHGSNSLTATVTVAGGKITSVTASHDYSDHESGMYVDSFDSSLSSNATGQSLASYSPSRIGGASLTTNAFDTVLDTIRTKAGA